MDGNVRFSTITAARSYRTPEHQTRRHRARTARLNRNKCQIDDVVDTTRCHGIDDFSKIVVAFKRVRSNCGAEYRRSARQA
jgi:hypothetical protein